MRKSRFEVDQMWGRNLRFLYLWPNIRPGKNMRIFNTSKLLFFTEQKSYNVSLKIYLLRILLLIISQQDIIILSCSKATFAYFLKFMSLFVSFVSGSDNKVSNVQWT